MSRRDDALYEKERRVRIERQRRKRRRKRLQRICLVVLSLVVLAVSVPYIVRNVMAGSVFLDQNGYPVSSALSEDGETAAIAEETASSGSSVNAGSDTALPKESVSEENDAAESAAGNTEDSASEAGETAGTENIEDGGALIDESGESTLNSVLQPWTYTGDAQMPDGDIVDMHADGYSYERVRRDLYLLSQRYPDYMTVCQFGTSLDDRELLDAVVGEEGADRDVIIQYSMHAREHIVTNLGMKQLEELLKAMETGQYEGTSFREIFSKVRLHIIPMMNPDGVMISQEGIEAIRSEELKAGLMQVFENDKVLGKASPDIREYATTWKANARSVDLNRNFDTPGWTTEMGTQQPSCSRYPGTGPNSEPEVQALIALTDSINCVGQVAYHCHGRLVYWDYGMESSDPALYAKDQQLAELFAALTATENLPGYTVVSTVDDGQNPGGCSDYYMQVRHIPAVTVEVGNKFKADGTYNDAPLSIDQIDGIYAENAQILPAVAKLFMTD